MSPYVITRRMATDYLTQVLENLDTGRNSANPIIRHLSKEGFHKVEEGLQWLDTFEGVCPVSALEAALGHVIIIDEENHDKVIYPPQPGE